jgi:hypothetical protein
MEGILLGESLVGDYDGKWAFNVSVVNQENFLDFHIHEEDTVKMGEWFETGNAELKERLDKPVTLVASDHDGNFIHADVEAMAEMPGAAVGNFIHDDLKFTEFSDNLNTIMAKDKELFDTIVDLVAYLTTTYSDKYESTQRANIARDFLLGSTSGDTACFNSIKYLQRYCTVGFEKSNNKKDLMKAIHYVLFELQRRQRND